MSFEMEKKLLVVIFTFEQFSFKDSFEPRELVICMLVTNSLDSLEALPNFSSFCPLLLTSVSINSDFLCLETIFIYSLPYFFNGSFGTSYSSFGAWLFFVTIYLLLYLDTLIG